MAMVNGESKAGKTWLSMTMPGPRLVLDVEGRTEYAPTKKTVWDPRQPPPTDPEPSETFLVSVPTFDTVGLAYQWIAGQEHPFKGLAIDSGPELQKRLIADTTLPQLRAPSQDEWGIILRKMEALTRALRDTLRRPGQPLQCIMMLCGVPGEGFKRPLFQGQYGDIAPYMFDLEGYLYKTPGPDGKPQRKLRIEGVPSYISAGDGTGILSARYGVEISEPNMTEILSVLNEEAVASV